MPLKAVIIFGSPTLAVVLSEAMNLSPLWEDFVVNTVLVFAVVVAVLKPAWGRTAFWKNLALVFSGHIMAVLFLAAVLQEFPPRRFGIPKLLLVPIVIAEGVALIAFLWKRTLASTNS